MRLSRVDPEVVAARIKRRKEKEKRKLEAEKKSKKKSEGMESSPKSEATEDDEVYCELCGNSDESNDHAQKKHG